MEELLKTMNRIIENNERFYRELSQKLEERHKSLVEADTRLGKIMEAVK
jgi:cell pole-organizing protein PopZ